MAGELVPLVMIPRFTTYTGESEFATAPLEVSRYDKAYVTLWRGPLVGGSGPPPPLGSLATFRAVFEASHDADTWIEVSSAVTSFNTSSDFTVDLDRRWLRVLVSLTARTDTNVAAITCWATGSLRLRVE